MPIGYVLRRVGVFFLVLWVAAVGTAFEVGENYRFRFLVGPLCAALAAVGWPKRRRA